MSSTWRVACVRIPRFPIGAVWRRGIDAENGLAPTFPVLGDQLGLQLGREGAGSETFEGMLTSGRSCYSRYTRMQEIACRFQAGKFGALAVARPECQSCRFRQS